MRKRLLCFWVTRTGTLYIFFMGLRRTWTIRIGIHPQLVRTFCPKPGLK